MRIALVTCRNLPDWEVDDRPLDAALRARGVQVVHPCWDDPEFDWRSCAAVLIRTTWDYTDRHAEYLGWVERTAAVAPFFNPPELVRWNIDKRYLHDLAGRGAATVPTVWLEPGRGDLLEAALRAADSPRGFLKPVVGANSERTLRFDNDHAGRAAALAHFERCGVAMMFQPYLAEVESRGEVSAILVDGAIAHAVRKVPVPGDYRVQDDWGAHDEPLRLDPDLHAQVTALGRLLPGRPLYARIDLLSDGHRWLCNEVELIEPSLFLRHGPRTADLLAEALLAATMASDRD